MLAYECLAADGPVIIPADFVLGQQFVEPLARVPRSVSGTLMTSTPVFGAQFSPQRLHPTLHKTSCRNLGAPQSGGDFRQATALQNAERDGQSLAFGQLGHGLMQSDLPLSPDGVSTG